MMNRLWIASVCLLALGSISSAAPSMKTQTFDRDPGWDGYHNRLVPQKLPVIVEDFGYSRTSFAGGETGEVGGRVQRMVEHAYYARRIPTRTLADKLTASGVFALTKSQSSSGVSFGWFNHERIGFRAVNSIAFRLDGEGWGARLRCDFCTRDWRAIGLSPDISFKLDGKLHRWTMTYDPEANKGLGTITFMVDDYPPQIIELEPEHKAAGAVFDRFGMFNDQKPGNSLTVYFDNVTLDGKPLDFTSDPRWEGVRNREKREDRYSEDSQDFGYSPTNHAGGKRGEIGGVFWRTEAGYDTHGYYGDAVGPLSLEDKLEARGKVAFTLGSADSGVYFGWFNRERQKSPPQKADDIPPREFVGVLIEGPSRVGHYFRPVCASTASGARSDTGPVILPDGKPRDWTLSYDPQANDGNGAVRATLDGVAAVVNLKAGMKKAGAKLDRFGFITMRRGGQYVGMYLDDVSYTAEPSRAR